jgi:integrase
MPTIRERANGTFELRIIHKSLPRPYYSTHDDRAAAERYALEMERALALGYVPPELKEDTRASLPISQLLRHYLNHGSIADSDREMVVFLQNTLVVNIGGVNVRWVDEWIANMKKAQLKPGTIRKRVESLARAVDWWNRREHSGDDVPVNPLRTLAKGYSTYREAGTRVKDTERDRRLAPGEVELIEAAIMGAKRADRQRPLSVPRAAQFLLMFRFILHTGLRLREAYSIRVGDLRLSTKTVFIPQSKTGRSREVPLVPVLYSWISSGPLPTAPETLLFQFWNGTKDDLRPATNRLSSQFSRVFEYAGCKDLVEHDLRHEATCRWMEMKNSSGQWLFRPEEVRRITGHKSVQQFERYLSLRGSDLADRLWDQH